jgi:uncharacterized membrane protein YraQ (UPF0718 family)
MVARMLQEIISIWLSFTPWLLLGTLIASAMKIWIPKNWINKHLGSSSGVWKAVALGVPLPLCSCGVIPTGLGLKKQGATTGATVGFLISTPQTGVDSILVTSAFLGWPFAIAKVLIALITGLIGGYLTQYFVKETDLVHTDHTDHESCEIDDHANGHSETHKENVSIWEQLVDDSLELIAPIWKWIVFGVFLSATISYYFACDFIAIICMCNSFNSNRKCTCR